MTISRSLLLCLLALAASFASCDRKVLWKYKSTIRSSSFQGADLAWLVTEREGALLFTSDSGKTWNKIQGNSVGGKFDVVTFVNPRQGFAVNSEGQVWRSMDGGQSWTLISKLAASGGDDWRFNSAVQLEFIDDRNGWLIETLSIWRTEDGGANWRKVFPPYSSEPIRKGQPTSGSFLNSKSAWVAGTSGEIYDTKDGAETWRIQTLLPNGDFRNVYFLDEQTGWLLGHLAGHIGTYVYRTDNRGESWSRNLIADAYVESIEFANANEGWAVGREVSSSGVNGPLRGVLLRTTDGGRS